MRGQKNVKKVRLAGSDIARHCLIGRFDEKTVDVEKGFVMKHLVSSDQPEPLELPAQKETVDRKKGDEQLSEWNKHPWLLQSVDGGKAFHGKRLAGGPYAVLVPDGDGYLMTPVREWFHFSKTGVFTPLNIEEAEEHLSELRAKTVTQAMSINKQLAADKSAAEAAVKDAKQALINKEEERLERRTVQTDKDGAGGEEDQDGADYEFEFSDDDESAAVMMLATDGEQKEKTPENPLERKVLSQEEKLERKLRKEMEEMERRQEQELKESQEKRQREPEEAVVDSTAVKKLKKAPVARPLTEEELISVLKEDANMTLPKLIDLFKPSLGNDLDKKNKWMKLVTKVAVQKTVGGAKFLRLREK